MLYIDFDAHVEEAMDDSQESMLTVDEFPRVIYGKPTLDQVICQLRYPAVLGIDAEPPARFQRKIRERFPNYLEKPTIQLDVPLQQGEEASLRLLRQVMPGGKTHHFSSEDGKWTLDLTRTFLALTTSKYSTWQDFKMWFEDPLAALSEEYSPGDYTRVGLRYVNVVRRSLLGLEDRPWRDLIASDMIGMLATATMSELVQQFVCTQEIASEGGTTDCRVITQLVRTRDGDEQCLALDADFFDSTRTKPSEAEAKLDIFNMRARRVLRRSITSTLHEAMEPKEPRVR